VACGGSTPEKGTTHTHTHTQADSLRVRPAPRRCVLRWGFYRRCPGRRAPLRGPPASSHWPPAAASPSLETEARRSRW
jgi:hypothetical protein